jgi:Fe-S-cluster containining protein
MKGTCVRCGFCCLYGAAIDYDVYQNRDSGVQMFVFKAVNKKMRNKIAPCEKLYYDIQTREACCSIYRNRPAVCKQFPYKEEELIFKDCGYRREGKK